LYEVTMHLADFVLKWHQRQRQDHMEGSL